jgi:Domain of unknown function (DUF3883)
MYDCTQDNTTILEQVRKPLLDEALRSPSLLADLAGLEIYIAESYDARSFIELLQNADDAQASRFIIQRVGATLLVANDGKYFTQTDFESLCRSAASSKSRGTSIGYRGIGFKSVVGFAEKIHLLSGELEATFSRELTAREIPQANRVPLVRIPHPLCPNERLQFASEVEKLKQENFTTIFVFTGLVATGIESEFNTFNESALLFLKHIRQVELRTDVEAMINVRRETIDEHTQLLRLASTDGVSSWILKNQGNISIAFAKNEKSIKRLDEKDAVVHAFLPTNEANGLAVKINADISTDPSRTRVVLDDLTANCIQNIAQFIIDLILEIIEETSELTDENMLAALIPFGELQMMSFQRRSFKTELIAALQLASSEKFTSLKCRPRWLNPVDFETLAAASNLCYLPRKFENSEGSIAFLKFLGVKEATLPDLSGGLTTTELSPIGVAEIVADILGRYAINKIDLNQINFEWKLWTIDGVVRSLTDAQQLAKPLDRDFIDLVTEKTTTISQLHKLLSVLLNSETAEVMIPPQTSSSEPIITNNLFSSSLKEDKGDISVKQPNDDTISKQPLSLKKWRSAEQQVLSLLTFQGWTVTDVSRQNIGYDLEGVNPDGQEGCIEVKLIKHPGQPFTLTSNEEVVARQKGNNYYLAIVRQTGNFLEVAFIQDPINKINLIRQCRQWVWECSDYDFIPNKFPVE